ncbi:PhnG protein [Agrobacterium fabacearum CFBP 5771]|jgi:alpha-D-ribose 1-methylphosphonate 5-triphosphate synthase subunit PhnG|uniref:phosphonate C-P lyase system protein PhnG n=1 Tax=Rhizobium/Agrobacterium group TaxID=227290 RepID=UPI0001FC5680|nr:MULTISPECIES: phosphonate C-P lyase system protein PhnG [Rhizobium/Agrobacterium group]ADY63166.1 Phosphonate metabolism protein [Agrobacterium tumefaciens]KQY53968.1 phosphonate C-P lyase system protein PhnG [Rhizobium sp. Root491]MDR5007496.1 phosphonate C-P lyase system protein PhnG [Agrobacterium tumefaciens]NSY57326.1 phosphonate C-P lyase system protein PhnG [Agrobacterium tumefaciens]OMP72489.1 phosphonate C-P lyase system protein PhnG [Agrobacterium tumefaciens]
MNNEAANSHAERKRVVALLARATVQELEAVWSRQDASPQTENVRGPETGLVMVKGRIGGGGAPFNLGETTVTRATVKLASGTVGHAHVLGTGRKKAWYAAVFDALWQENPTRGFIETELLSPVEKRLAEEKDRKTKETAATRVDFFTMVRGED